MRAGSHGVEAGCVGGGWVPWAGDILRDHS